MGMVWMKYWQERKSRQRGTISYRYRRIVDAGLKEHLGKGEIVIPLGNTQAAARKAYDKVHQRVEKMLADAWDVVRGKASPKVDPKQTPRERFQEALERARDLGVNPYRVAHGEDHDDDVSFYQHDDDGHEADEAEWIEREVLADGIAAKHRPSYRAAGGAYASGLNDPDHAVGLSKADAALIKMLVSSNPKAPPVTVMDAKKRYLEDRFALSEPGPLGRKKDEQRAERAVSAIVEALGRVPTVAGITREEARKVQAYLRDKVTAKATVDRYLNDIRSIINHALKEFDDLHGLTNHFTGLPDLAGGRNGGAKPEDEGRPLTGDEVQQIRQRVETHASHPDLLLIWRVLEGTGCRLAEVTGLRVADVIVGGEMPYIDVAWHEGRRLKTIASRRRVPLIGDALEAAKQALELAGKGPMLFPRYGVEGGNTNASAALMKHVRVVTKDKLARVHSLRHGMKDKLKLAGVETSLQNLVLGHALEGEGNRYGGPEARLVEATMAMRKALC